MSGRPHLWAAAALLVIQAALTVWGVTRNSVKIGRASCRERV